jgi:GTPase SAR1 family protein
VQLEEGIRGGGVRLTATDGVGKSSIITSLIKESFVSSVSEDDLGKLLQGFPYEAHGADPGKRSSTSFPR